MYYVNKQLNNVNKKTILVYLLNFLWKKKFGFFEKESKNCAELWFFIRKKRYEKYYVKKKWKLFWKIKFSQKYNEILWAFLKVRKKNCCASKASKTHFFKQKKIVPYFFSSQKFILCDKYTLYKIQQKKNWRSSSKDCSKKNPACNADQLAKKKIHYAFPRFLPTLEKNIKCLYIIMWYCVQNGIKHAKLENYSKCLIFWQMELFWEKLAFWKCIWWNFNQRIWSRCFTCNCGI